MVGMIIKLDTSSRWFQHVFSATLIALAVICFSAAAYSWTGPTD